MECQRSDFAPRGFFRLQTAQVTTKRGAHRHNGGQPLSKITPAFVLLIVLAGPFALLFAEEPAESGFVPLFDGKSFNGWEGNLDLWKINDGMIVGDSPGIKDNEFLATTKNYADFELRLEFRMHDGKGNSGVQFRSKRLPDSKAVEGYQADLGQQYWGCLYDEHRRRKILAQAPQTLFDVLKKDGWNTYVIRAQGDRVILKINELTTVDYREPEEQIARSGIIALQIHSGPAMRMDFRNIRIKMLNK